MKEKIIYSSEIEVNGVYVSPGTETSLPIVTYVIKYRTWYGCTKYKIKQSVPVLENPFYDCEYKTNRTLERCAQIERAKAQVVIDKYKMEALKDKTSEHETKDSKYMG